jgi:hypothetical protein
MRNSNKLPKRVCCFVVTKFIQICLESALEQRLKELESAGISSGAEGGDDLGKVLTQKQGMFKRI